MDDGYFPRASSMLRRVHEQKAVGLLYGQRALCIGALKPLNYVGTSEHTHNKHNPFRRITHTALMFETVFFGDRQSADRTLKAVHRMHQRVHGSLPEDAGEQYPAGTPYSAFDPQLMLWTVAVIADSAEWFHDHLVRPLRDSEREALWQDYLRFASLFGMPTQHAPASHADFRGWYESQLAGEDLYLTEEARYMGYVSAFQIPMSDSRRYAKRVHDLLLLGSLPTRVRECYGLSYTARQAAGAKAVMRAARLSRPLLPSSLRHGSCAAEFERIAAIERRRIERGEPTPQLVPRPSVTAPG